MDPLSSMGGSVALAIEIYIAKRADSTECGAEATKENLQTCLTSDTELLLVTAASVAASANSIRVGLV